MDRNEFFTESGMIDMRRALAAGRRARAEAARAGVLGTLGVLRGAGDKGR